MLHHTTSELAWGHRKPSAGWYGNAGEAVVKGGDDLTMEALFTPTILVSQKPLLDISAQEQECEKGYHLQYISPHTLNSLDPNMNIINSIINSITIGSTNNRIIVVAWY